MIGGIYSDSVGVGSRTVVTAGRQFFLEGAKTIVDTSNRFRVVTDIMYDDFVQFEKFLDVVRQPLTPRGAAWRLLDYPGSWTRSSGGEPGPSHEVAKSYGIILVTTLDSMLRTRD